MLVTVFIPTGNRAGRLKQFLSSLTHQSCKDFEVVIVDNHSTDNTLRVVKTYKKKLNIIFLTQATKGLVSASNQALRQASGDIFVRTDDDVVAEKKWIEEIINIFLQYHDIGGLTGPAPIPPTYRKNRDLLVFFNQFEKGSLAFKFLGFFYSHLFLNGAPKKVSAWFESGAFSLGSNYDESRAEPRQDVTNLEPCNYSVRTKLLHRIGGFNTLYIGIGEYYEADAAFRIRKLGYRLVFDPKVVVHHHPSRQGAYTQRGESHFRMSNFIFFYLNHIRVSSFSQMLQFLLYLLFLHSYYFYKFLKTLDPRQLGAFSGTLRGIILYYQYRSADGFLNRKLRNAQR
ncbi:glycosyltransferase family 2 protein [Candidatus Roizmanbacteria bacterium]|nr:glycosyltransferase family 2 protein [Candidatus Roizmanbacteria bacterium]